MELVNREEEGFLEFVRLRDEIEAEPKVYIRYTRESYFGKYDQYARVTFDRKLLYQPTDEWESFGRGRRWLHMDSSYAQRKLMHYSGVVMELKTLSDAPAWMLDMVRYFGLERTGNCKYSTAINQESLFRGEPILPQLYMDDLVY
ncbi:MAG: VTC domain-containing protein [Verrucomicrobiota bacterium]